MAHLVVDGFEYMLVPLLPLMQNMFLISYAQTGITITTLRVADSIGQMPSGYLAHKFRKSSLTAVSITVAAMFSVLFAFATTYSQILLLSIFVGLSISPFHLCVMALIAEYFPKKNQRGKIIGLFESGSGLAQVAVVAAVNATIIFLGVEYWRLPFILWAIPSFSFAYIILKKIKPLEEEEGSVTLMKSSLMSPRYGLVMSSIPLRTSSLNLTVLSVINALRTLNYIGVSSFLLFFLQKIGVDIVLAGVYLLIFLLVRTFAMPIGGSVSDRFGRKVTAIMCSLSGTLLLILLTYFIFPIYLLLILISLGFVLGMLCSIVHSYLSDVANVEVGSLAFYFTSGKTASALAPFIMGAVADLVDLTLAFRFFAAILGLTTVLIAFVRRHEY